MSRIVDLARRVVKDWIEDKHETSEALDNSLGDLADALDRLPAPSASEAKLKKILKEIEAAVDGILQKADVMTRASLAKLRAAKGAEEEQRVRDFVAGRISAYANFTYADVIRAESAAREYVKGGRG